MLRADKNSGKMDKILIVIPARYASTRLPGKPLVKIAGIEMIRRVAAIAECVCQSNEGCNYAVATDDERISSFCHTHSINCVMTSESCKNGTERCLDAVKNLGASPGLVVNLQGDNPLCPPWIIQQLIDEWKRCSADVYTPCVHLSWQEFEAMLAAKSETPYSGTTVLVDRQNFALAFSKNVIPAVRKPAKARESSPVLSPVRRHIGLYAYTLETLKNYAALDESEYEKAAVEGLEQMRFLYNGLKIKMTHADFKGRETTGGVDSPEDVARVEAIISKYGEFENCRIKP